MFFFGHVGITTGIMQAVNAKTGREVDLRFAALLAVAPDLVDKPVGILFRHYLGNHTRLWGHSFIFAGLALALIFVLRRKAHPFLLWAAFAGHLVLDRIWEKDLHAFFWPFMGLPPDLEIPIAERWIEALSKPYTFYGEVIGIGVLMFLFVYYRLWKKGRLKAFRETGLLENKR